VRAYPSSLRFPWLPPGYVLDELDPDFVVLRCSDGRFVAAFSALGATEDGIRQAVEDDLRPTACENRRA
jgi:hypothetical protein